MKTTFRLITVLGLTLAFFAAGRVFAQGSESPKPDTRTEKREPRENHFETLVVQPGESAGEVTCLFCSVVVLGTVDGEAVAVWGNVDVQGTVKGEATAVGGSVRLRSGSHVTDDATAVGGRIVRETGATLDGDGTSLWYLFFPGQRELLTPGLLIYLAIHVLLVFFVFAILRAGRVQSIGAALQRRPGLTILVGILANSVVIAAISFLQLRGWADTAVSLGLPLLLVLITLPGIVGLSFLLGRTLRGTASPVAAALLGTTLLVALSAIPLAGLALYTLLGVLAAGAALVRRFGFAPVGTMNGATTAP